MREIKFRCWDGKTLLNSDDHFDSLATFFGYYREQFFFDEENDGKPTDVIFSQFTGLTDKKGVDIYEGDIIDFVFDGVVFIKNGYDIIFQDGAFLVNKPNFKPLVSDCNIVCVIGNIYESPELLTPANRDKK